MPATCSVRTFERGRRCERRGCCHPRCLFQHDVDTSHRDLRRCGGEPPRRRRPWRSARHQPRPSTEESTRTQEKRIPRTRFMGASAVLPPLVRDQTVDLRNLPSLPTCPIEPKPAGDQPIAPSDPSSRSLAGRHECPRDTENVGPSNPRPLPPHRARHRPPGLATRAHPLLPPTISGPKSVDHLRSLRAHPAARPVGGATPCTLALAAELPPPRADAAKPKLHDIQHMALGNRRLRPTVDPHDPLVFRPPLPTPPTPQGHDPKSTVLPPNPHDRVPKNRWLPPVLPQVTADHGIAPHHRAYPQDGPLSEHGRSRVPPACTPRACASLTGHIRRRSSARRLVKPISSESSEPTVSTLPPTRTAPRIHASSPSPNHAVDWFWSRRIGASSDSEVADTNNKCSRSPSKRSHKRRPLSGVRKSSSRCCHRAAAQRR